MTVELREVENKRVHYFPYQLLEVADFETEQEYHVRMRRHCNRMFTFESQKAAIAWGLNATKSGEGIRLTAGLAFDFHGREIAVFKEQGIAKSALSDATIGTFALTARVREAPARTDPSSNDQEKRPTRQQEVVEVRFDDFDTVRGDDNRLQHEVLLAKVTLADGKIEGVDATVAERIQLGVKDVFDGDLQVNGTLTANTANISTSTTENATIKKLEVDEANITALLTAKEAKITRLEYEKGGQV